MASIYDDAGYTGEVYDPESVTRLASLDFYRDKIREFQASLNALDQAADSMRALAALPLPPAEYDEAVSWLTDYEANRGRAIAAAQAINVAAESANALGIRMPVLSWRTLQGVGNPVMIAAVAGAIGAGAWFLTYAIDMLAAARAQSERVAMIESLTPEQRAEAVQREQEIALAKARAENPISAVASTVKWVAFGIAAWFAFKAVQELRQ